MKTGRSKSLFHVLIFLLLACLAVLLAGCDKYQRYEVLTFFFTGVPHPDEVITSSETSGDVMTMASVRAMKERKRQQRPEIKAFAHGPFGAGQCHLCHESGETVALKTGDGKKNDRKKTTNKMPMRFDSGLPGRLVSPLKQLCVECHASKSMDSAYNRDLWIHGPVSDGLCTACHSPHQSPYEFMLLKGKSSDMCRQCHGEGFIIDTEAHREDKDCTDCHNAHVGKNRFLLKEDFEEHF